MPPRSDNDELSRRRTGASELLLTLPAAMGAPSMARERLGRWLDTHGWPDEEHDDLLLAVSEAVSNSVEHGYGVEQPTVTRPGVIEVHGIVVDGPDGHRHAVLSVTDHGTWLAPSEARGNRRHGLPLMAACADSVTVDGTSHGTTVVLRSRTVPPVG